MDAFGVEVSVAFLSVEYWLVVVEDDKVVAFSLRMKVNSRVGKDAFECFHGILGLHLPNLCSRVNDVDLDDCSEGGENDLSGVSGSTGG